MRVKDVVLLEQNYEKQYSGLFWQHFLDLGYSHEDAEILKMRADLMAEVRRWISDNSLTQAEAAEVLQVSQSRISDLVRGKWEKFSLEMLIVLAMRSGFNLTLSKVA